MTLVAACLKSLIIQSTSGFEKHSRTCQAPEPAFSISRLVATIFIFIRQIS